MCVFISARQTILFCTNRSSDKRQGTSRVEITNGVHEQLHLSLLLFVVITIERPRCSLEHGTKVLLLSVVILIGAEYSAFYCQMQQILMGEHTHPAYSVVERTTPKGLSGMIHACR